VGVDNVNPVFLRGSQLELIARIAAIPVAVGIATQWELNTPMLIAGGLLIVLALFLSLTMPESGFTRVPGTERRNASLIGKVKTSTALISASPLLMTVFGIALFYGMTSEGVDRLWEAHFLRDLHLPVEPESISLGGGTLTMEPIVWFGLLRLVSTFVSLGASEVAHRRLDLNSDRLPYWLFTINMAQMASLVVLALAGGFWLGVAAFLVATALSRIYDPLSLGWLNRNIRSEVRATVLSMRSQADSLGQISGGPVIGAVGSLVSLRAALLATSAALLPALALYLRAFGIEKKSRGDDEVVEVAAASSGDGPAS
jgi:hypothetical protein